MATVSVYRAHSIGISSIGAGHTMSVKLVFSIGLFLSFLDIWVHNIDLLFCFTQPSGKAKLQLMKTAVLA